MQRSANCALLAGSVLAKGMLPSLTQQATYRVGFAQTESDNPWRVAQTASMKDEAKRLGFDLSYTDAQGSTAKQVADVRSLIAKRVDVLFLSPREDKALAPVVKEARDAGIPVILLDRTINAQYAVPGRDYLTFIGSDFVKEGGRVATWLVNNARGKKLNIIELEGTVGATPTIDRKRGFDWVLAQYPPHKIVVSQSADFSRDKGRQLTELLLEKYPEANVIYAHNDEMAIGAVAAIEAAGKKPGKDIMVLSIDGGKEAVKLVLDGKINYVVECNPRFGPEAFKTLQGYAKGKSYGDKIVNQDRDYTPQTAKAGLSSAY
ncbi:ABC transporter substrate-binding protein [Deinococcus sp.]|uniref:ABC transporter substrate-binding protein n=1 Tax=Deinococcus sp. TaxID=47478 RepID=UPI0025FB2D57|nr:ABC transporter substrate-binding protein [Deinococcus sp.]